MKLSVCVFDNSRIMERHMGITDRKFGCIFLIAMLGCYQRKCDGYDIRCPQRSEWKMKASSKCGNTLEYFCLFDANTSNYTEFCKRNPDPFRDITWKKGQRCVFRGNLDGELCPTDRYQPFKFRTDGNSDCAYKTSLCKSEGLIVYKKGPTTIDTQCRCDHTKGFAFLAKTKQNCYCIPSEEDCSCYKKACKGNLKISPDYNCTSIGSWDDQSICPGLHKRRLTDDGLQMPKFRSTNMDLSADRTFHLKSNLYTLRLIGTVMVFTSFIATIAITVFLIRGKEIIDFCSCAKSEKINYNDIIIKIDTTKVMNELSLTGLEKETIDACFGRIKKNKALLKIIVDRDEAAMDKEFIKVLHRVYYTKNTEIYFRDGCPENVHNEKIPDDVRQLHDRQIRDWIIQDKRIICTRAYNEIVKRLETDNWVFLVGGPGSGKSSILRKSALTLVTTNDNEDFDIVPLVEEPSTLLKEYYNKNRNQIFVIDDSNKELSIKDIKEIIRTTRDRKTKILVSCNTRDFNYNFEALKKHSQTFLCELSKFPLTPEEKERMMKIYVQEAQVKDIDLKNRENVNNFEFPLLCKLSKGKNANDVNSFFSDPLTTLENDLKTLHANMGHQFCAIALCCLLSNFKVEWLNPNCGQADNKNDVVKKICLEFKVNLQDDYHRKCILDQFDIEQMNWLIKSGDTYRLINQDISNIVTKILQTSHTDCFLKYSKAYVATWKSPERAW